MWLGLLFDTNATRKGADVAFLVERDAFWKECVALGAERVSIEDEGDAVGRCCIYGCPRDGAGGSVAFCVHEMGTLMIKPI